MSTHTLPLAYRVARKHSFSVFSARAGTCCAIACGYHPRQGPSLQRATLPRTLPDVMGQVLEPHLFPAQGSRALPANTLSAIASAHLARPERAAPPSRLLEPIPDLSTSRVNVPPSLCNPAMRPTHPSLLSRARQYTDHPLADHQQADQYTDLLCTDPPSAPQGGGRGILGP